MTVKYFGSYKMVVAPRLFSSIECSLWFSVELMMFVLNLLATLLATSVVLAEAAHSNPHHKAAKHVKRSTPPISTKDAPRKRDTSLFLTNSTASMFSLLPFPASQILCFWVRLTFSRICSKRLRTP